MRWPILFALGLLGCTQSEQDNSASAMALAQSALAQAETATNALDEGTSSGTTMGDEVDDAATAASNAADEARQAKDIATQAWNKAVEQEERIDAICYRAPALCS